MVVKVNITLDKRFKQKLQGRYGRYEFQAGILKDGPHRDPMKASAGLGSMERGPVRKKKQKSSTTNRQVGEFVRKVHRVKYLTAPFEKPRSKTMVEFRKQMGLLLTGKARSYSKVETALRAVIRLPILMKKYGSNTRAAIRRKTFNRKLIDTGQFFRSIVSKVRSIRVQK